MTYEEGISYAQSRYVTGIWVCGGMRPPENGFFPSTPLLPRSFVVATLAANEATVDVTGKIDALVTEKSVFRESLRCVPEAAGPDQAVEFHEVFTPIAPRILFTDRDLRDRFDAAWQELIDQDKG